MSDKLTFLSAKEFKKVKSGSDSTSNLAIRKQYVPEEIKQKGDENSRIFEFVISTGAVDRDQDTIDPKGWDLKQFKKNPIVLFAHDSGRPPIGRGVNIKIKDDKLKASVEFMDNDIDTTGFSDTIFRMVRGGFLRATSVGFMPTKFEFTDDEDRGADSWFGGIDFIKQELLEFSIVPVPSNPEALLEARSKGIDTAPLLSWFEEALDDWAEYKGMLLVPRKEIENLYKKATGKGSNIIFNLSKGEQADLLEKNLEKIREQQKREEKVIVSTESTNDHTHEIDDEKGGVSGPASNGDDHDHSYKFGEEETAPGGDDNHTHVISKFQASDHVDDDEDDDDNKDDDKPNSYPNDRDDGEQPNEHPIADYGNFIDKDGRLLVTYVKDNFLCKKLYILDDLLALKSEDKELPENVTDDDVKWLVKYHGKEIEEIEEIEKEVEEEKDIELTPIKLKIITDGTTKGTQILDSETGRLIDVESATFNIDGGSKKATVSLVLTEAIIELQQYTSEDEDEDKDETEPVVSKSKETDREDFTVDDLVEVLEPEKEEVSTQTKFSDDDILDVVKEVMPDLLRDIVKEQIGRLKGRID